MRKAENSKWSLSSLKNGSPCSFADIVDNDKRPKEADNAKRAASNFGNLLKKITLEQTPSRVLFHSKSNDLSRLVFETRPSEPKFRITKKPADPRQDKSADNQNVTIDEYNRALLTKNPFSFAKLNKATAFKPKLIHVRKFNKTQIGKLKAALKGVFRPKLKI